MTKDEALKLALETLEICAVRQEHQWNGIQQVQLAKHALREALAQPEPVLNIYTSEKEMLKAQYSDIISDGGLDPRNRFDGKREWIGLTDDEIMAGYDPFMGNIERARAIEAKLKEKNT